MHLAVIVQNFGPALATDFSITIDVLDSVGTVEKRLRLDEAYFAPGARRRFLPLENRMELDKAAEQGVRLRIAWQWRDSRRDWRFRTKLQASATEVAVSDVRDAYLGSEALLEQDVEYRLSKIEQHLREGVTIKVKSLPRVVVAGADQPATLRDKSEGSDAHGQRVEVPASPPGPP